MGDNYVALSEMKQYSVATCLTITWEIVVLWYFIKLQAAVKYEHTIILLYPILTIHPNFSGRSHQNAIKAGLVNTP